MGNLFSMFLYALIGSACLSVLIDKSKKKDFDFLGSIPFSFGMFLFWTMSIIELVEIYFTK